VAGAPPAGEELTSTPVSRSRERRRIVVPPGTFAEGGARVSGGLRHHLVDVLRLGVGAPLEVVDGSGTIREVRIAGTDGDAVLLSLEREVRVPASGRGTLTLLYGLARSPRTDLVVEKAAELGVDAILPALCARSVVRTAPSERRLERWRRILREASRQCGRLEVPSLRPPAPLGDALLEGGRAALKLIASPGGVPLEQELVQGAEGAHDITLAIGPEGGFADDELELASTHGFVPVGMGSLVLRTETAAIVGLALVAFLSGRL
jgi:16S rRNA (uracil1498-N3)-methyltransferase